MTRLSVTVASHSMLLQSLPNSESSTVRVKSSFWDGVDWHCHCNRESSLKARTYRQECQQRLFGLIRRAEGFQHRLRRAPKPESPASAPAFEQNLERRIKKWRVKLLSDETSHTCICCGTTDMDDPLKYSRLLLVVPTICSHSLLFVFECLGPRSRPSKLPKNIYPKLALPTKGREMGVTQSRFDGCSFKEIHPPRTPRCLPSNR